MAPPQHPAPSSADRARATWAAGDYGVVATRILLASEGLCETADLQAGWRVLDVATGTGNAAFAAARRGCAVVGLDIVPSLLEHARRRAVTERLEAEFVEGDAQSLPFPDASFDAVLSVFGVMFAPDHQRAAAELARVCRRGGTIALASWTPDGYVGRMFRAVSARNPPPAGAKPPILWGDESHLRALFGGLATVASSRVQAAVFRSTSPEDHVNFFRTHFGPTIKAFAAIPDPAAQADLTRELTDLARTHDRNAGAHGAAVAIPATYLETILTRA